MVSVNNWDNTQSSYRGWMSGMDRDLGSNTFWLDLIAGIFSIIRSQNLTWLETGSELVAQF